MAHIAFLDMSFPFDGDILRCRPLGGVQRVTVLLAEALAARGHRLDVFNANAAVTSCASVTYRPLAGLGRTDGGAGVAADLVVVNREPRLFSLVRSGRKVLWLHGPAGYLRKARHVIPLLRHRPTPVFLGPCHRATRPWWLPMPGALVLPLAVGAPFTEAAVADRPPPPRAIFLSNPRRSLDWLVTLWMRAIQPRVPGGELHVYCGSAVYGGDDPKLEAALGRARALAGPSVIFHPPAGPDQLATELRQSRAMLYRGDPGETWCVAAAEASAMGVPIVTAGIGSLAERVIDDVTGFIAPDPAEFTERAVQVLTDDGVWQRLHDQAVARRTTETWSRRAAEWEAALLAG